MASRKLEDRIEELRHLRRGPSDSSTQASLRKALTDRSNLIVAEAAKTIGELRCAPLIPDLLAAFDRFFDDPVKTDPKCWAKTAIVKALVALDYADSRPFLRGARHVQMEPVYVRTLEDTAPLLRATSFLALVQCDDLRRIDIFQYLVDAMSDPADPVRIEAVRAIAQLGGDEGLLLLRMKARLGDSRPLIIGHVFDALLELQKERVIPFVAEWVKSANEELRDEAALALGASRLPSACKLLVDTYKENANPEFGSVLLRSISSSRLSEAIDFLLEVLKTGETRQSAAALEALKLHEHSPEIQMLIEQAKGAGRSPSDG